MPRTRSIANAIGLMVLANLFWSGNYIAGRYLAHAMPALFLNGMRWTVSAVILLIVVRARGGRVPFRREAPLLTALGLLGMFMFSALTYLGLQQVPAAQAGMISGLMPISIMLFGAVLTGERTTPQGWLGTLLAVCGVLVLMAAQLGHSIVAPIGIVELLGAAICWGAYTALGRKMRDRMGSLEMTAGAAVFGAVPSAIAGAASLHGADVHWTPLVVASVAYISTVASVVAYWAWNQGVAIVGAVRSAPFGNLLPIFTVALGIVVLREHVTALEVLGGAITVAGALIAQGSRRTPDGISQEDALP
ncbi:MAG: DMT family transporter [Thermaerobacter sp.]|nr:DMT family transporter [Thermaerobacter sp.]